MIPEALASPLSVNPLRRYLEGSLAVLILLSLVTGHGLSLLIGDSLLSLLWTGLAICLASVSPFSGLMGCIATTTILPQGMVGQLEWQLSVAGVPMHPADLVYVGTMTGWLFGGGFRWLYQDVLKVGGPKRTTLVGFTLALLGWSLIGMMQGESIWNIVRDLRNLSFYGLSWLALHQLESSSRRALTLNLILAGSLLFSLHSIGTALSPLDSPIKSMSIDYWNGIARIYYHNHHLLLLTIPVLLFRFLREHRLNLRALYALTFVIEWVSLTLSLTRSMMAVTILSSIAAAMIAGRLASSHSNRNSSWAGTALIGIIATTVGLCAGTVVTSDFNPTLRPISVFQRAKSLSPQDSSVRGRVAAYKMALEDFSESPIMGHGLGSQMRIPWAHTARHNVREANRHPAVDSTLLTLMFKFGTVGLLLTTLFTLWFFRSLWRRYQELRNSNEGIELECLALGLLSVLAISLVQANLIASRFVLVFVVWCVVAASHRPSEAKLS